MKWQFVSFTSRGVAQLVGIVQSIFIVRYLSVAEYGVIKIAESIGGSFGITQHLGLASGSTREISSAKNDSDIFKIFTTAVIIRYCVTIPIAVGLFLASEYIAIEKYNMPQILTPLRIFSLVILIQGVQSMLNSVVSGTRRFKALFVYQGVIAFVSLLIFVPFVFYFRTIGYFLALLTLNVFATVSLSVVAFRPLRGKLQFPSKADFKRLFKELLSISLAIYAVKVLYTFWEKSGPILLGLKIDETSVGVFAFALLYAKKLMNVSDAVTDVNLPVLSEKYEKDFESYRELFTRNFNKIIVLILFSAMSAIYWSNELILVLAGSKYSDTLILVFPTVFAFMLYSLMNIIKSSIYVPAKYIKGMISTYLLLLVTTVGAYFILTEIFPDLLSPLLAMSYSFALGSGVGLAFMVLYSQYRLRFKYFTHDHFLLIVQVVAMSSVYGLANYFVKVPLYVLFVVLYIWAVLITKFMTRQEIRDLSVKLLNKVKRK